MIIEILVYPGVDELDAIGPLEVFRNAERRGANFVTRVVSLDGPSEMITGNNGLHFAVNGVFGANGRPDLLVVPGGGWVARAPRGARAEAERGAMPRAIADAHRSGTVIASVCTGGMLVASAGLLRGRAAITHHSAIEDLRSAGAQVTDARVVDDGDIVTAGGVTSGIDLALHLVERFAGPGIASQVSDSLEYERRGPVHVTLKAAGTNAAART